MGKFTWEEFRSKAIAVRCSNEYQAKQFLTHCKNAGRSNNQQSREYHRGVVVTVRGRNGVNISYERLLRRVVNEGEVVQAGDIIGYEGNTGSGKETYLALRFSRTGRLIDGCQYLGIPREIADFNPDTYDLRRMVARAYRLTDAECAHIDAFPGSEAMWRKLYKTDMGIRA